MFDFNNIPTGFLLIVLVLLIAISAFFSASETGLMLLNPYRLRHQAKKKNKTAVLISKLLQRLDRLLGVILLGNNLANLLAASIASVIAIRLFGEVGILLATLLLTIVTLLFAEIGPKTLASIYPEAMSRIAVYPLRLFLKITSPIVNALNWVVNRGLRVFGIVISREASTAALTHEELRVVVHEAGGMISKARQRMLLSILELEDTIASDVMTPRSEITGIDLEDSPEEIERALYAGKHTRLPVYRGDINAVTGVFHIRSTPRLLSSTHGGFSVKNISSLLEPVHFVPDSAPLHKQLLEFQHKQRRMGVVVDEYGTVQGLITLEDILEEIVGEFSADLDGKVGHIKAQADGSYIIDGKAALRHVNRRLSWDLPITDEARTLNGMVLEHLESLPKIASSFRINDYVIEILETTENSVKAVKIKREPALSANSPDELA